VCVLLRKKEESAGGRKARGLWLQRGKHLAIGTGGKVLLSGIIEKN